MPRIGQDRLGLAQRTNLNCDVGVVRWLVSLSYPANLVVRAVQSRAAPRHQHGGEKEGHSGVLRPEGPRHRPGCLLGETSLCPDRWLGIGQHCPCAAARERVCDGVVAGSYLCWGRWRGCASADQNQNERGKPGGPRLWSRLTTSLRLPVLNSSRTRSLARPQTVLTRASARPSATRQDADTMGAALCFVGCSL